MSDLVTRLKRLSGPNPVARIVLTPDDWPELETILRMDEKPSRYPWGQAPEWARWAATDRSGQRAWYEVKPSRSNEFGWWMTGGQSYIMAARASENERDNWRNSLEKRLEEL